MIVISFQAPWTDPSIQVIVTYDDFNEIYTLRTDPSIKVIITCDGWYQFPNTMHWSLH